MILFIHIPKTAGTSFRIGMEQTFNKNALMLDYGPNAPETDVSIQKLYQQNAFDPKRVSEMALTRGVDVVCGHFPLSRYKRFFPDADVISFVREPLQRSYSEYLHFQRYKGYSNTFEVFFNQKYQVNLQSKFLEWLPPKGIVGCSEYYEQSLELIQKAIGLSVPTLKLNCNRAKLHPFYASDVIGKKNMASFYKLNDQDVRLYEKVKGNFSSKSAPTRNTFSQFMRNVKARLLTLSIVRYLR